MLYAWTVANKETANLLKKSMILTAAANGGFSFCNQPVCNNRYLERMGCGHSGESAWISLNTISATVRAATSGVTRLMFRESNPILSFDCRVSAGNNQGFRPRRERSAPNPDPANTPAAPR